MARNSELLYMKLSDALAEKILDGTMPEGTLLPSERELCQTHNISRTTVRQALANLSALDLIYFSAVVNVKLVSSENGERACIFKSKCHILTVTLKADSVAKHRKYGFL